MKLNLSQEFLINLEDLTGDYLHYHRYSFHLRHHHFLLPIQNLRKEKILREKRKKYQEIDKDPDLKQFQLRKFLDFIFQQILTLFFIKEG
jgi:hypothetical protein